MRRLLWCLPLLSLSLVACHDAEPLVQAQRPVLFTEVAAQQSLAKARFTGTVQPRHQLVAAFRQSGRLLNRQVEVGQHVRAGQLLASLENSDQRSELRSRQGEFERAEALWRNARDEFARYQGLHHQGVGSQARLEQLQGEMQVRAATLRQARIALQRAEEHVQQTQVLADLDGVITAWHAEIGQVLASGSPVVSLAHLDSLEVWVDVPTQWIAPLTGSSEPWRIWVAPIMSATTEGSWARVRQVDPLLDPGTRVQRLRLALEQQSAGFHLGSLVSVELSPQLAVREPELPASALWAQAGQHFVWRIEHDSLQVRAVAVEVMSQVGSRVRVRGALQAGDRVVSAGVTRLHEGQQIRLGERSGS